MHQTPTRCDQLAAVTTGSTRWLVALLLSTLAACGGGAQTSSGPAVTGPVTVGTLAPGNGVVMKGPLSEASVQLFPVGNTGVAGGPALATVTTDASGRFVFDRPAGSDALLAVTRGGSFVDEADPETDPALKRRIAVPANQGFESLLPAGANSMVITPYTHALLLRARRLSANGGFLDTFAALRNQAAQAMGFDPITVVPESPLTPNAAASIASKQYALAIGGAAQSIQAQALALGAQPNFDTVMAFTMDLSDGRVDGLLDGAPVMVVVGGQARPLPTDVQLNQQIQRFRNNNAAAYQGVATPVVNEAALSQPPSSSPPPPPPLPATLDDCLLTPATTTPWTRCLHVGALRAVAFGPAHVRVSWPQTGATYNLYVTADPNADLANINASGGVKINNVTSPATLGTAQGLTPGSNVYVALEEVANGNRILSWTSTRPDVLNIPGSINALAIGSDGTRYAGGSFGDILPATGGSGLLLSPAAATGVAGGNVLAFPAVLGSVFASIPDGQGGFYIGGSFFSVGGESRRNLAQIDRRGQVTAWAPKVNGQVNTLLLVDEVIYVGGFFNSAGSTADTTTASPRGNLAAFDRAGTLAALAPKFRDNRSSFGTAINSIAVADGTIYVGGFFDHAGGTSDADAGTPRINLAAFNLAGELTPWAPKTNTDVQALGVLSGVVYVTGGFTGVGGSNDAAPSLARRGLAAFDLGGVVSNWQPKLNGSGRSLLVLNNVIYVGGSFINAGSSADAQPNTPRGNLAAFTPDGQLTGWAPNTGGSFTPVVSLVADADTIYAGGFFFSAGGSTDTSASSPRRNLAAFGLDGVLRAWSPLVDAEVRTLAVSNRILFAGGFFGAARSTPDGSPQERTRSNLAAFTPDGALTAWTPGISGTVRALAFNSGVIYAGGDIFSAQSAAATATFVPRNRLAAFDVQGGLTTWAPEISFTGSSTVPSINTLIVADNVIYAGGNFSGARASGQTGSFTPRSGLAAFDAVGALTTWAPQLLEIINPGRGDAVETIGTAQALLASGNVIYAGGFFNSARSTGETTNTARLDLAAFDLTGALTAWAPKANTTVSSLAINSGVIYAAGLFDAVGSTADAAAGTSRSRLAAFDLAGALTAWAPQVNGTPSTLSVLGNVVYAGGGFSGARSSGSTATFTTRSNLAAFDQAGTLTSWAPATSSTVASLAAASDGISAVGFFTAVSPTNAAFASTARQGYASFDVAGALIGR